jgi:hypothetical protein
VQLGFPGPYTFDKAVEMATLCYRSEDIQIGDSLHEIAHKFEPEEFHKLLCARDYLAPDQVAPWLEGSSRFTYEFLTDGLTEKHLDLLASQPDVFDNIVDAFDWGEMDSESKFEILRIMVSSLKANPNRDESPTRH